MKPLQGLFFFFFSYDTQTSSSHVTIASSQLVLHLQAVYLSGLLFLGGRGPLPEKLGGGMWPTSQNPYPIYDQNLRYPLPYLWPDQKFDTLSYKYTHIKVRVQKPYPIYDQNGRNQLKLIPYLWAKQPKNHTLWGRTYLYSPYKGVPHGDQIHVWEALQVLDKHKNIRGHLQVLSYFRKRRKSGKMLVMWSYGCPRLYGKNYCFAEGLTSYAWPYDSRMILFFKK